MDEISDNEKMSISGEEQPVNANDSDDNEEYNDYSEGGWIQWFCQLEGNEFFVEVDEDFIRNRMNYFGLSKKIKNYK